jgi:hypothetical protein
LRNFTGGLSLPAISHHSVQLIFSPFISAEALCASDISPVPNLLGGTVTKIKQATKSKTNGLASNALLGPSKDGRQGFQIRTITSVFLSLAIRRKKGNKTLIVLHWSFL